MVLGAAGAGEQLLGARRPKWRAVVGDDVGLVGEGGGVEGVDGGDAAFLPVEVFEVGDDVLEGRERYGRDEAALHCGPTYTHQIDLVHGVR